MGKISWDTGVLNIYIYLFAYLFIYIMEISTVHSINIDTDPRICILHQKLQVLYIYTINGVDVFLFIFKYKIKIYLL